MITSEDLKKKMTEVNISSYRLSQDTGIAYSNIHDILNNKKNKDIEKMSFKNIIKILKYLYSRKEIIDIIFGKEKIK